MIIYDNLNKLTIHAELFKCNDSKEVNFWIYWLHRQNWIIRIQSNYPKITTNATIVDIRVTDIIPLDVLVNFLALNIFTRGFDVLKNKGYLKVLLRNTYLSSNNVQNIAAAAYQTSKN